MSKLYNVTVKIMVTVPAASKKEAKEKFWEAVYSTNDPEIVGFPVVVYASPCKAEEK